MLKEVEKAKIFIKPTYKGALESLVPALVIRIWPGPNVSLPHPKIQQTKMLVTCQRFGDLFSFGLVWQYSSVQTKYNKVRFKVMATYLQQ